MTTLAAHDQPAAAARRRPRRDDRGAPLAVGLALFGAYHLLIAVWMVASPRRFFDDVGPFGAYNAHYLRDIASFEAAFAAGLLAAVWLRSWRVPVLAVVTLQFALHSVNHLFDIDHAHPAWLGRFDFVSLAASTLLLGALLRAARRERRAAAPAPAPDRASTIEGGSP